MLAGDNVKKFPYKALIRSFLLLGIMLGVSLFLMRGNSEQIIKAITYLKWTDALVLLALASSVTILQGMVFWKIIKMNGYQYSLKDALQNVFISGFISTIFSTTFGKGAQFALVKSKNISWETVCHVGLIDQLMYYIADISLCSFCIFLYQKFFRQLFPELWWVALTGLTITVFIFLGLVLLYIPLINRFVLNLVKKIMAKLKPQGKLTKLLEVIRGFVLEVKLSMGKRNHQFNKYLGVIGLNMVKVLIRNGLMFMVIYLLNDKISFYDFPIYFASACFLEMALSALPVYGDKGTAEIGFVLVFGSFIGNVQATSAMLVWRFFSFYMNAVTGGLVLAFSNQIHLRELLQSENRQTK